MRLFIALELSEAVRAEAARMMAALAPSCPSARWVEPEAAHLTLAFLGSQPPERVSVAAQAARRAAARARPFRMAIAGVGAFVSWERPDVVWAGIAAGAAETAGLAEALQGELRREGFTLEDRRFHPHVTLCRPRRGTDVSALRRAAEALPPASACMEVSELAVMESRAAPDGARYATLERLSLGTG